MNSTRLCPFLLRRRSSPSEKSLLDSNMLYTYASNVNYQSFKMTIKTRPHSHSFAIAKSLSITIFLWVLTSGKKLVTSVFRPSWNNYILNSPNIVMNKGEEMMRISDFLKRYHLHGSLMANSARHCSPTCCTDCRWSWKGKTSHTSHDSNEKTAKRFL